MHEGTEGSGDTAPSIYNLNATYRSVVGSGYRVSFTPLFGKPRPTDHILPAAVTLVASESFRPHVSYTPVRMKDNFLMIW